MKKNITELLLIIDESGSMFSLRQETIGELNAFIKAQQKQNTETRLTVVFFNTNTSVAYEHVDINTMTLLDETSYQPNGLTALFDAIGTGIITLNSYLDEMPKSKQPSKVMVAIMTDGLENASKQFSQTTIHQMIEHQINNHSWEFYFIASNIDSKPAASSIGIDVKQYIHRNTLVDGMHYFFSDLIKKTGPMC